MTSHRNSHYYSLFFIILLVLVLNSVRCENYVKTNEGLTEVPTNIPGGTTFVNLDNNKIKKILTDAFLNLVNCKKLFISNNDITEIESGAFRSMVKLTELGLGYNILEKLRSDMFSGLPALEILRLNQNKLDNVVANTFSGHNSLYELDISENAIRVLRRDMFKGMPSLSKLHIEENLIQTISLQVFVDLQRPLLLAVSDPRVGATLQCDCRFVYYSYMEQAKPQVGANRPKRTLLPTPPLPQDNCQEWSGHTTEFFRKIFPCTTEHISCFSCFSEDYPCIIEHIKMHFSYFSSII